MKIDIGGGVRLYVDVDGAGLVPDGPQMREKPTLICMHGGPGFDHSAFKPAFGQLTDLAQVIYYDHRGHGRSDPRPSSEWNLDVWADDVVRLCDALGIVKPIVLGQSFGGFVGQRYLARHPGHASKVILSSTSHHMGLDRKLAAFERRGGPEARALAEAFWARPSHATFEAYWAGVRHLYNTRPAADPEAGSRTLANIEILLHFVAGEKQDLGLLQGLARAECPVLVMVGEDDPVCPLEDALEIYEALPAQHRQLARFPGVGHGAWRDDPVAAFKVLREFIAE
ncbi:alpha/beta fold hydrolase [Roseateles terrae]|uniref:Proline iminopeptidase n=1 Tax=Roseateles terrae TaxID=431060 RepID=A0ABR6GYX7_9BURK|nr:alpha/beta hydrolase [Roseateles terrae]MBB3197315.1 proline iminopeptidase [Roseateles terrae]OWQ83631.1 prolyl aminopeptidase [Roseateles terrae]